MKIQMQRFTLVLVLLCALSSIAWRSYHPRSAHSPSAAVPGLDLLPPLPFSAATMDLPRIRDERRTKLAAVNWRRLLEEESQHAVTYNGLTLLHMDVDRARAQGEKWIEVSLKDQMLYAWDGGRLANRFTISSGVDDNPTVTGLFRVWARTASQTMDGGDRASGTYYNLPNVPWVQYFYHGYAFHGTYWHNNFGAPMSRGCVNLTIEDAEWLFNWAFPGWSGSTAWLRSTRNDATLVWVHQ
ncbi:MAG: L,D-transpeptidase [Caldilineaceae bacterium SB0670_bin_27]|uniref:L,D-transpeptidase n=1 Tax=Caldilineaceae bacterium SB0664_bin_27 TaxID=2605260 RepID=A0A6B0YUL7_9CHLR|nr:L,D-transpeptidase [Caldilineaceae bacterium SB0664_bin_27]MYJ77788.1 L,D-transpeptidase [Caldilineaceae bacterium SB0670_bin_27]